MTGDFDRSWRGRRLEHAGEATDEARPPSVQRRHTNLDARVSQGFEKTNACSRSPTEDAEVADMLSKGEWAEILLAIEQAGSMITVGNNHALRKMTRIEVLARRALEDLQQTRDEAKTAVAAQREAEARARAAETCAQEAEVRADQAELRAAEAERMLMRVRNAVSRHLLASEKYGLEERGDSAA